MLHVLCSAVSKLPCIPNPAPVTTSAAGTRHLDTESWHANIELLGSHVSELLLVEQPRGTRLPCRYCCSFLLTAMTAGRHNHLHSCMIVLVTRLLVHALQDISSVYLVAMNLSCIACCICRLADFADSVLNADCHQNTWGRMTVCI